MLTRAKRIKSKKCWKELFKIELLFVTLFLIFFVCYKLLNNYMVLAQGVFARKLIFSVCCGLGWLYIVLLITSKIISSNKSNQINEENYKSRAIIFYLFILPIFLIILFFDVKPILIERLKAEKNIDLIINYLNSKYGDNNYKVGKIKDLTFCFLGCSEDEYSYSIKSDNLSNSFEVIYNYYTNEIVKDTFIYEWGKQNKWFENTEDFYTWTKKNLNMKYNKHTNEYIINFQYEANMNYAFNKELTIDEYLNSLNLTNLSIEITRDFSKEEEFLEFIINVYKELKNYELNMDELNFKFRDLNPFYYNKSIELYKTTGVIKENDLEYLVYYNNDPKIIKK